MKQELRYKTVVLVLDLLLFQACRTIPLPSGSLHSEGRLSQVLVGMLGGEGIKHRSYEGKIS